MENVPGLSSRDKIKIIIITAIALFVSAVGISYAYFAIQITGNDTASSMRLTSANMQLIYTDVQIVSGDDIEPGWTETKTLTVQNVGNVTSYYTIIWRDLLNEITNDELVISATCVSTSGSCPNIAEKVIPTTTPEGHNINVKKNISIPVGVTHTYTVTIEFIETGSNQNYNQDKIFNGTLNIAEGKEPLQIVRSGTDSTTGLPVVTIGTEEFYVLNDIIDYSSLISTNGNIYNYSSGKSILLAKYNLYVGQNCTSSSSCTPISTSATGYGLQSEDAKGYTGTYPSVAVVPFSGSSNSRSYWYDSANNAINSKYGTSYNASNIYDTDYITAPNYSVAFNNNAGNANYSIAYYVEEYVERLGIEGTGRLLTYTEANAMTQAQRTNGAQYWLGSASYPSLVWIVSASGALYDYGYFFYAYRDGVRPVIVVDTADIKTVPIRAGTDSDTGLPKVTIGSEEFLDLTNAINYSTLISTNGNIYNYASDKTILLAKYNLYVGRTCTRSSSSSCTPISTSASGYGLQSADAKGDVDSSTPRVAVVPFSGSSDYNGYWYDSANSTIYSKYGTSYDASNIYDTTYNTAPNYSVAFQNNAGNANYSIAYYVEEYVDRLGIEGEGRLLTYTEANAMTTAQRTNGARFWLGSANYDFSAGVVNTIGDLDNDDFSSTFNDGVRPVIVVNTSIIQGN